MVDSLQRIFPRKNNVNLSSIVDAQVFGPDGGFAPGTVAISDGRFVAAAEAPAGSVVDASGLWLIPGVYDCHTHLVWSDFHAHDREARSDAERGLQLERALRDTLHAGVTSARDAGGTTAAVRDAIADGSLEGPRVRVAVDMIGADDAGPTFRSRVVGALEAGADWIKLVGTIGVGALAGQELRSHFTEAEYRFAVETAREAGARVMVHAWGGEAIDHAVETGVASIEHGMYLTPAQAAKAAAASVTFVPTLTIYRLVRQMVAAGELAGVPLDRVDAVLSTHRQAVLSAYDAGLPIAIGSDFSTVEQHGTNLVEIAALMRAGLPAADALFAATRNGAALLADADGGTIAPGFRADAVLLKNDPTDPATFDDPHSVVGVVANGELVHFDPTAVSPSHP